MRPRAASCATRRLCSACSVAAATPAPTDGGASPFIAFATDFAGFASWSRHRSRPPSPRARRTSSGPRTVYINALPPPGAAGFRWARSSSRRRWRTERLFAHGEARRRRLQHQPARSSWEWFELEETGSGAVIVIWHGVGPPSGETYGGDPNAAVQRLPPRRRRQRLRADARADARARARRRGPRRRRVDRAATRTAAPDDASLTRSRPVAGAARRLAALGAGAGARQPAAAAVHLPVGDAAEGRGRDRAVRRLHADPRAVGHDRRPVWYLAHAVPDRGRVRPDRSPGARRSTSRSSPSRATRFASSPTLMPGATA